MNKEQKQLKQRYNYHKREAKRFSKIQSEMIDEGFEREYTFSNNCPANTKRLYHEEKAMRLFRSWED